MIPAQDGSPWLSNRTETELLELPQKYAGAGGEGGAWRNGGCIGGRISKANLTYLHP